MVNKEIQAPALKFCVCGCAKFICANTCTKSTCFSECVSVDILFQQKTSGQDRVPALQPFSLVWSSAFWFPNTEMDTFPFNGCKPLSRMEIDCNYHALRGAFTRQCGKMPCKVSVLCCNRPVLCLLK